MIDPKGTVLITGTTGFFAGQLLHYLAREFPDLTVYGFDRSNGQDLRNAQQVDDAVAACQYVFHLGALTHVHESIANPRPFMEANIGGTINILEACRKHGVGLTQISSSEYYGTSLTEPEPMTEEHPCNPHSPYGASKAAQDRLCYAWHQTYGLDVRIVRPFNQYGPGQDVRKVIPRFMYLMMQGKPMTIHGNGEGSRDYVWVQDTVEGIWLSQHAPAGEAINLGTGNAYSTNYLAKLIVNIGEREFGIQPPGVVHIGSYDESRWGHVYCLRGTYKKAFELTGWAPKMDIEEGIHKTWQWMLGNGPSFYRGGEMQDGIGNHPMYEDPPEAGKKPGTLGPGYPTTNNPKNYDAETSVAL